MHSRAGWLGAARRWLALAFVVLFAVNVLSWKGLLFPDWNSYRPLQMVVMSGVGMLLALGALVRPR